MSHSFPKLQVEVVRWGFKVINGEPYLDDNAERYTDAKKMLWDTVKKVIVENG
jgi:hypothetical protein